MRGLEQRLSRRTFGKAAVGAGAAMAGVPLIGASAQTKKFKVAFIYVGPIGDMGWSWSHDQGRKYLEANVPNVETAYSENVAEGSDSERVIRDYAQKGYDLVVATSFGYMDPTINVARQFPKTQFIHISGYKRAENVSTAFGMIEEPRYVAGMIAGHMTTSNLIGYVAAFPTPEVVRGANAFTLGALKTNPKARLQVVWTNSWYDPRGERLAAEALLDKGCDVLGQHQDTAATAQAAQQVGKYAIGYDGDQAKLAPKSTLTCPIWHWGVYYVQAVQKIMASAWQSNDWWGGWKDGVVDLSPIGPMVPDVVRTEAEAAADKFRKGEQDIFNIFAGPLIDQNGKERKAAGQKMNHDELWNMQWFVQGVDGKIPS